MPNVDESERLMSAAIIRDGKTESGSRSHYELRMRLDPADAHRSRLTDVEGFMTSTGRFVDREEAKQVAMAAGQISLMWKTATRSLLSSDIDW